MKSIKSSFERLFKTKENENSKQTEGKYQKYRQSTTSTTSLPQVTTTNTTC